MEDRPPEAQESPTAGEKPLDTFEGTDADVELPAESDIESDASADGEARSESSEDGEMVDSEEPEPGIPEGIASNQEDAPEDEEDLRASEEEAAEESDEEPSAGKPAGQPAEQPTGETAGESIGEPEGETDGEDATAEAADKKAPVEDAAGKAADVEEAAGSPAMRLSFGKKAVITIVTAVVLVLVGCFIAFAVDDANRSQFVPETTMLEGTIDISGMTEPELRELLANRTDNGLSTTISLWDGFKEIDLEMEDIGSVDIDATITQAFEPNTRFMLQRCLARGFELATGMKGMHNVSIKCAVDPQMLEQAIAGYADRANCEPRNACYAFDEKSSALVVSPATEGVTVDAPATAAIVEKAAGNVTSADPNRLKLDAVVSISDPEVLEPGQAILVDTRGCRTRLYENGTEVASYACTPGASGYATPRGDFTLWYKDPAPTWINPHSDWSKNMEETIPPGASNPLGLRALAVSCGGGIFLHGTTNTGGLGRPGSHGCVRLSNDNIIELYNRVSEGIPIIIR